MTHPLWQLLLLTREPENDYQLTCEECYELLEFDADLLAIGANPVEVRTIINRHLALCSSYGTKLDAWLEQLEISFPSPP